MATQHEQLSPKLNLFDNYVLKHSDGRLYCTICSLFTKEEQSIKAKQLADSFNNTVGAGIEPSAVEGLKESTQNLLGLFRSLQLLGISKYFEESEEEMFHDAEKALEAAKIK